MTTNKKTPEHVEALKATEPVWQQMTLGRLIRSIRMCDEISQADLAKKLKVSRQFLSDVERGRKEVGIPFVKKIAAALGEYSLEPFLELLLKDQLKKNDLHYNVALRLAMPDCDAIDFDPPKLDGELYRPVEF